MYNKSGKAMDVPSISTRNSISQVKRGFTGRVLQFYERSMNKKRGIKTTIKVLIDPNRMGGVYYLRGAVYQGNALPSLTPTLWLGT